MTERDFWIRMRAHYIEQEKALTELRAAVIGQRKAIERMLDLPPEPRKIINTDGETASPRPTYDA
jgi:hypothetical protein